MTPQRNYKPHFTTGKRKEVTRTRTTLCSTGKKN
ncbi:unnamed protein product [Brassica rapa]|uniref:Uncharacterized protein n=1 Tax=Brassica campestris TaxID=3711 RepID=A0A8D9MBX0_BRACM|nr:unnamed protein product [Brassica rapa]